MDKPQIRSIMRSRRKQCTLSDQQSEEIANIFFDTLKPAKEDIIAFYYPCGSEISPLSIYHRAQKRGIICTFPIIQNNTRILEFHACDDLQKFEIGPLNIDQPPLTKNIFPTIILVPLIAYDPYGNRLGQGGGYYDATLQNLKTKQKTVIIGIAYTEQIWDDALPSEEHDVKLDAILTPNGLKFFK